MRRGKSKLRIVIKACTYNESIECVSMQVVTCQWVVVIQLLEFRNPMNIETKMSGDGNIKYCCCDTGDNYCTKSIPNMKINTCAAECDIFFVVSLQNGTSELSSISTINETILNSPSHSLNVGYTFSFTLGKLSSSVSTKIHYINVSKNPLVVFITP